MLHNLQISMVDVQTPTQFNSDLIVMLRKSSCSHWSTLKTTVYELIEL